jgi:Uncharacterized protein conserved in cyanobacteria
MSSVISIDSASDYGDLVTYDLVDGHKVPRKMGNTSNLLAGRLQAILSSFVEPRNLGYVIPECIVRINATGVPRRPDVLFVRRDRFDPTKAEDKDPWDFVPNLAVEVVSKTNTFNEIEEKMEDYFAAGVEAVWVVSNRTRRVTVYTSMKSPKVLEGNDAIDAAPVLPGLIIPLEAIFAVLGK